MITGALGVGFACLCYSVFTLPDVRPLAATNPGTTAFMDIRADEAHDLGKPARRAQRWVGYNRISRDLKRAVLVAEDAAFFDHEGIDFQEIRASLEANWEEGKFTRGASTITQQLAKNLYLSPARTPMRKLRELIIARRLEAELSKRRILELYLNVVEWGDGIYGAEAASRTYFRKPASALSPSEAALLAGALVNARVLVPSRANARLLRRQRIILARMGAVTPPVPAALRSAEPVPAVTIEPVDEPRAQDPSVALASTEDAASAPPR